MRVCVYACMRVYVCMYGCVSEYVPVCVYLSMCQCMYALFVNIKYNSFRQNLISSFIKNKNDCEIRLCLSRAVVAMPCSRIHN